MGEGTVTLHIHITFRMKRTRICLALATLLLPALSSEAQVLTRGKSLGTHPLSRPLLIDSVNLSNTTFDLTSLIKRPYQSEGRKATPVSASAKGFVAVPKGSTPSAPASLSVFTFDAVSPTYTKGNLRLYGRGRYALYADGVLLASNEKAPAQSDSVPALSASLSLEASHRELLVKVLSLPTDSAQADFKLSFVPDDKYTPLDSVASANGTHFIDWKYITHGKRLYSVSVSPSGKYALVVYADRIPKKGATYQEIRDASGKVVRSTQALYGARWMPRQDYLLLERSNGNKRQLLKIHPTTGEQSIWADNLPGSSYFLSPDERTIYFYEQAKGPAKAPFAIRRLSPDDRQPGWRDRTEIYRYDVASGVYEPLTYGVRSNNIYDVSEDGSRLLLGVHHTDWTKTPYGRTTVLLYTPATAKVDTLIRDEIELADVSFIPGTNDLLVTASPNSFDFLGSTLPAKKWGNGYERELFRFNISTRQITPLTKDFDPSIANVVGYGSAQKAFFFSADNGSRKSLYRLDVRTNKITPLNASEDVVRSFSISRSGDVLWYLGQSLNNADRLYQLKAPGKSTLVWDLSAEKLRDVRFTPAKDFVYRTPDGVNIDGWYYLPPNFDPTKKYPMIVYYYGGTIPLTRELETTYDLAMFASQGYIALSLNPRGCTGYGQAFAADHLNAWGTKTADDIIGAVKAFTKEHSFVNEKKIGCCGASYGGFMTQYLQTKTDIFAAAISHAGISSISSYWAGGYWGITYSSVASTESYPWNNPDLYTKHSPLFNADKIHTPLLLLHGTSDVNVPPSESTALYNALKILGRTVELVEFTGEDHHILEPDRKDIWMRTMFAWFAKYLQDKPEWWDKLYPKTVYER